MSNSLSIWRSLARVVGVVFLRFRPLPKVWASLVVAVNGAGLAFFPRLEAVVAVLAILLGMLWMAAIYSRYGFVRVLGSGHVFWLATLPWIAWRLPLLTGEPIAYLWWLKTLLVVNAICLIVDTVDAVRYFSGESVPHYEW